MVVSAVHTSVKDGSQCDARPCVALICETLIKYFSDQTQGRNANERKDRIRVYSCVVLRCNECQREGDAMQHMV